MGATPSYNDLMVLSPYSWIREEQKRQMAKWGEQNHGPYKYHAILAEEMGEVSKVLEDVTYGKYESHEEYLRQLQYEIIQVCSVGLSWVEAIRREKGAEQPPKCSCKACRKHDRISTLKALIDDISPSDASEDWERFLADAAANAVRVLEGRAAMEAGAV